MKADFQNKDTWVLILSLFILLLMVSFSVSFGTLNLFSQNAELFEQLVSLRLQRALSAAFAGASLALCGSVLQRLLNNSLADAHVLGFSSGGAAFGALLALMGSSELGDFLSASLFSWPGFWMVLGCFVSLFVFGLLWHFLNKRFSGQLPGHKVILLGMILNTFFASVLMIVFSIANPSQLYLVQQWLLGNVRPMLWRELVFLGSVFFVSSVYFQRQKKSLMLMSFGHDYARARGVPVGRALVGSLFALCFLVGLTLASAGSLGFVGLIVPHLTALFYQKSKFRKKFDWIVASFLGASLVVLADTMSRTELFDTHLPVGVYLASLGAPLLTYFILRKGKAE
jgi:iron complex transport system permease protein